MGGNAGIRGYIIQTLICLLDALDDNDWITVTVEPLDESEKVDIRWRYTEGGVKFCQVKSSQNVIRLNTAKRWCTELENIGHDAATLELIIIGHPDENLLKTNSVGKVKISGIRSFNTEELTLLASAKIDIYYSNKGKSKISPMVRELMVQILTSQFNNYSIIGKEIGREEFDNEMMKTIAKIESQVEHNPFAIFAPPSVNESQPLHIRLVKKIMELIGWNQFSENYEAILFNDRKGKEETHIIDFYGDFESKLKEKTDNLVFISSIHEISYSENTKNKISEHLNTISVIHEDFNSKRKAPKRNSNIDCFSLLFWLSTDNSEAKLDFINRAKENFKNEHLENNITYFLIDNERANFLISSIITAKNYRDELPVKFLYPITELNQSPGNIGIRGLRLPVEYINSSIIPIIKESSSQISILLFCSDPFSTEGLKKIIWLIIKLSSGLGNEYRIYFPDYISNYKNEALEIIRSFNDENLESKITIDKYTAIDSADLDLIPIIPKKTSNESYIAKGEIDRSNPPLLNETFTEILPYGDVLKPFLKTDAITASDLKIFLSKKGIFLKNADKNKITTLMSVLLFSPKELDEFRSLIDIKIRPINTVQEFMKVVNDEDLTTVFNRIKPNTDNILDDLSIKLLNAIIFKKDPIANEFVFSSITEKKDLTNQMSLNTTWGKIEIRCKKEGANLLINTVNTISRDDKIIANRIVKAYNEEFKRINFVENESIGVLFSDFKNNIDRVRFLLSFTEFHSSSLFKASDIRTIKYQFDESELIPEEFQDKIGKDLIMYFSGKNLSGLNEISDVNFQKILLLEEINITYQFEYFNIKKGYYTVKYNFSDALKGRPIKDGAFRSEPKLYMSQNVKAIKDIDKLKRELSREVDRIKLDKLKKFNIIA